MVESRTKNSIRNVIAGWINKIVILLFPFIIQTCMIRVLGAEYLGLSSLFTSILQAFAVIELGFSTAIVFCMYRPIVEEDTDTICGLMKLYRKVYFTLGCIIVFVGICLLPFLKYFINGEVPQGINIYSLFLLYLVNTSASFFLFSYKSCLLIAHQRNDIVSNVHTAVSAVQYIIQICLLLSFKNYYIYFVITPICTILNNLISAWIAHKRYPEYICRGEISTEQKREIKEKIKGLFINKISRISKNTFDNIFISAYQGLVQAARYSNYYWIMSAIQNMLSAIVPALTASVGNSVVLNSPKKNYENFRIINFAYIWLGGWFSICLLCIYQPFIRLWMGEDMLLSSPIMVLFCACLIINSCEEVFTIFLQATGIWEKTKKIYFLNAIFNLILNFLFVNFFGVLGVVLVTVITTSAFGVLGVGRTLFREYFKEYSFAKYLLEQGRYIIESLMVGIIMYVLCNQVCGADGIIGIIQRVGLCAIIPNALFVLLRRKNDCYQILLQKIVNVRK